MQYLQVLKTTYPHSSKTEINSVSRIRRVECDEAKPACMKCTRTGRKCDGYPIASSPLQSIVADPNVPHSKSIARVALETTFFYSLPFKIPGSQNDRQLLHYYCVHASSELAGFSYGAADFWSQLVLQYSHDQPVVRGALIAVASVHRNFVTKEAPGDGITDALKVSSLESLLPTR